MFHTIILNITKNRLLVRNYVYVYIYKDTVTLYLEYLHLNRKNRYKLVCVYFKGHFFYLAGLTAHSCVNYSSIKCCFGPNS